MTTVRLILVSVLLGIGTTSVGKIDTIFRAIDKGVQSAQSAVEKGAQQAVKKVGEGIALLDQEVTNLFGQSTENKRYIPYTPAHSSFRNRNAVNILFWNVYMRPHTLFKNGQYIRASAPFIPAVIGSSYDVLIFAELFDDNVRKRFLENLKAAGYPYSTPVLGGTMKYRTNGGIVIASKYPIALSDEMIFGYCLGSDCLAAKGVLYALIHKDGRPIHIFASHMQAHPGSENLVVRAKQSDAIKKFIEDKKIPNDQLVVIAGDFNTDKWQESSAYQGMLARLNAKHPTLKGARYSIDPALNDLVDAKKRSELLDYILYSKDHLNPSESYNYVIPLQSPRLWKEFPHEKYKNALSDHFPVHGYFYLGSEEVKKL
jgi:endonuclease/exonuclease/phosphatase family metal-dependent hydrolase